mmetsp:Transcript_131868/g.381388  ORF Transcript_131868/g.381388 Transcript_131868/m.381388 type:complete len:264 (-) Transcript_131868:1-792(-)
MPRFKMPSAANLSANSLTMFSGSSPLRSSRRCASTSQATPRKAIKNSRRGWERRPAEAVCRAASRNAFCCGSLACVTWRPLRSHHSAQSVFAAGGSNHTSSRSSPSAPRSRSKSMTALRVGKSMWKYSKSFGKVFMESSRHSPASSACFGSSSISPTWGSNPANPDGNSNGSHLRPPGPGRPISTTPLFKRKRFVQRSGLRTPARTKCCINASASSWSLTFASAFNSSTATPLPSACSMADKNTFHTTARSPYSLTSPAPAAV